jgi:ribosomal protein S18 acetylase RimI-like enzyme
MSEEGPAEIRLATTADAAEVARLLHDFNREFDEPSPGVEALTPRVAQLIAEEEILVLLAGGGPDGLAELRFKKSVWSDALDAYLEELYVVPALRGNGIGRALLDAAMNTARERGADHIDLTTSLGDKAAIALYESSGFTNEEGGPGGPSMVYYERDL